MAKKYADTLAKYSYPVTNLITNGDFSNGLTGWTKGSGTAATVVNGELVVTALSAELYDMYQDSTAFKELPQATDVIYAAIDMLSNSNLDGIRYGANGALKRHSGSGEYERLSFVSIGSASLRILDTTRSGDISANPIKIKNVVFINLTATFGVESELSINEMNDIVTNFTPQWFEETDLLFSIKSLYELQKNYSKFRVSFETASIGDTIATKKQKSLSLIAVKSVNYYHVDNPPVQQPTTVGYLYLDEDTQKLYYSSGVYNKPEYLCDWDTTLAGGLTCDKYHATITNDGDIIFLRLRGGRANPIVYPAGDYANPVVLDFGANPAPVSGVTDSAICHHYSGDYFVLAEYVNPSITGDPIYIWKVSKPYTDVANWVKVDTWTQRLHTDGEGPDPTREIAHFHMAQFDFYSGQWIVSTGDLDYQCRILVSDDDANTFTQVAQLGQATRMLGMVFTPEAAYWGTDSPVEHFLCKALRNESGILDFSNIITVTELFRSYPNQQPTYTTCLVREPYGLLFLDRAESRADGKLNLDFFDLTEQKLYTLGVYNRIAGDIEGGSLRHGFGNQAVTQYQSVFEDGIICGSTANELTRRNSIDVLGNTVANRIGNLKIKIVKS